jgi:hypothetical protein
MKKMLLGCVLLATLSLFSSAYAVRAYAAKPTTVEVLYMNHGPLMDTLDKMKNVFSAYGDRIRVSWYDFESKEGEDFMAKKGVNQHVPLVIWIDGNAVVKLGQKQIKFVGFPTGAGPAFFQGKWTIDDLKAALDQVTVGK